MSSLAHHLVPATAAESKPSSASASASVPSSPTRLLTPTTNPIPLLPSPLAKKYSLAHTFAIAAYYYLRASALVHADGSDPFHTMFVDLVVPTLLSLILTLTLPPLPLTIIALVLGAPLYPTSLLPTTLLLAMHVSILGFLPLFYTHGVSASAWRDVAAAWLPFDEAGVWAGTVGCLVGGWVGAVPMALDWDREWQKWPCTVLWGIVAGWVVGRLVTSGMRLGLGSRIDLSEKEEVPPPPMAPQLVSEAKGKDQHQHQIDTKKGN
ncbi:hypothetical protein ABEF95_005248 [Exophiala dermatitidis]